MRVVAIRNANQEEICPQLCGIPNPKIILDNGDIVWGWECWWCSVEKFEKSLKKGRTINIVPNGEEGDKT